MKKIILGIILSISFVLMVGCSSVQENKTNETETSSLVGETNEIETSYQENSTTKPPYLLNTIKVFDSNDVIIRSEKYEYDDKGNILKQTIYDADNHAKEWYAYSYDDNSNIIKEESFYLNEDGTSEIKCYESEYNEKNQKTYETFSIDGSILGKTKFDLYDSNGNIIKKSSLNPLVESSTEIISWTIYDYDIDGLCIKETHYNKTGEVSSETINSKTDMGYSSTYIDYNDDGSINRKTENTYNSNEDLVDYVFSDENGNVLNEYHCKYEYNNNNQITFEEIVISIAGDVSTSTSHYEYDDNGNLIKLNTYDTDGQLINYKIFDYIQIN